MKTPVLMLFMIALAAGLFGQGSYGFWDLAAFEEVGPGALYPDMPFKGAFEGAVRWEDAGGENFLIVSRVTHEQEMRSDLWVYQYRKQGGSSELVWDIFEPGSPLCDPFFQPGSLEVLDLNRDGYLESCFVYEIQCDGTDPIQVKMMLHSRSQKLALRGQSPHRSTGEGEWSYQLDPAVREAAPVFGNFLEEKWKELKEEEGAYSKTIEQWAGDYMIVRYEYMYASGGWTFRIKDRDFKTVDFGKEVTEAIWLAEEVSKMPDSDDVLYVSLDGVGVCQPSQGTSTQWMTFFEDTEAISQSSWSPDGTKLAFVTLNHNRYPLGTKLVVLDIDHGNLVQKRKFDLSVWRMAAADWVVESPRWNGNAQVGAPGIDEEAEPTPVQWIHLD